MNWEDKLLLQNSKIHGMGVFAKQAFAEGDYIGQFVGKLQVEERKYTIWLQNPDNGMLYLLEGTGVLKFLNHANQPNAKLHGDRLYALKNIEVNEEITIYYSKEFSRTTSGNHIQKVFWKIWYAILKLIP